MFTKPTRHSERHTEEVAYCHHIDTCVVLFSPYVYI